MADFKVLTTAEGNALAQFPGVTATDQTLPQPGFLDQMNAWQVAWDLWQQSLRTDNTRRSYKLGWQSLINFCQQMPWEISSSDLYRWVDGMKDLGLSDRTVNQRLSGISAFYQFVIKKSYRILASDGREIILRTDNPAEDRDLRRKVQSCNKYIYLDATACRALLAAIPRDTLQGKRDYALFLGFLLTGRRSSEWRAIRWGQFEKRGRRVYYTWMGRGQSRQKHELPPAVWTAVLVWLHAAGRQNVKPDEFVFTALTDRARRLPNVCATTYDPTIQPLSMREVGDLLKKYAKRAGLDYQRLCIHGLRHSAAMLRRLAGDDVEQISALLAHSSLAVTQMYLHGLENDSDRICARINELLGV